VEATEKKIRFGEGQAWKDLEADEMDLGKGLLPVQDTDKVVAWEQWGGIVERGNPKSLLLQRLNPAKTKKRAPGPGPIRKRDWKPMTKKWIKDRKVILHTDGARSYKMVVDGVIHDNVVHAKKKKVINGKTVWLKPHYTKVVKHKLPGGRSLKVKAGTQIIDRAWRHVRSFLTGRSGKVSSVQLRRRIRSAQWEYWNRGEDMWLKAGEMIQYLLK